MDGHYFAMNNDDFYCLDDLEEYFNVPSGTLKQRTRKAIQRRLEKLKDNQYLLIDKK